MSKLSKMLFKFTLICVTAIAILLTENSFGDDFSITYPKSDATIRGETIEIQGAGATQGSVIEISVLTDKWYIQDGTAEINKDGTWSYAPCYLSGKGKFSTHTIKARQIKDKQVISTSTVRGIVTQ